MEAARSTVATSVKMKESSPIFAVISILLVLIAISMLVVLIAACWKCVTGFCQQGHTRRSRQANIVQLCHNVLCPTSTISTNIVQQAHHHVGHFYHPSLSARPQSKPAASSASSLLPNIVCSLIPRAPSPLLQPAKCRTYDRADRKLFEVRPIAFPPLS